MKNLNFPITQQQIYLLKAITGNDETSIDDYKKWVNSVNLENYIDGDSFALIPSLYKRLVNLNFSDVNMNRYMGIYKKSLYKNGMHFFNLYKLCSKLNTAEIEFALLKGSAYTLLYHKDIGIRSMNDIDILVSKDDIKDTINLLGELGYKSDCNYDIYRNIRIRHSYSFRNNKGQEIDLHWYSDENPEDYMHRQKLRAIRHKNVELKVLAPETSIIFLCNHGLILDPTVNIRWIFDLFTIISNVKKIDWKYILSYFNKTLKPHSVALMFKCYNEISFQKIPLWVIKELEIMGNNPACKKCTRKIMVAPKTFLGKLGFYYYNIRYKDKNIFYRLFHFPKYILYTSKYNSYKELLKAFIMNYILHKKNN